MVPSDHAKTAVSSCTRRISGAPCIPVFFVMMESFLSTETVSVSVSVYIFKFHCIQFHKATKRTTNKVTRIQGDYRELIQ